MLPVSFFVLALLLEPICGFVANFTETYTPESPDETNGIIDIDISDSFYDETKYAMKQENPDYYGSYYADDIFNETEEVDTPDDIDTIIEEITKQFISVENEDLSEDFFLNVSLGRSPINGSPNPPDHFDWRDRDMVGPVKNQGKCNGCWAFSIAANVESHLAIYTGQQEQLSEQFLIDCVSISQGCAPTSLLKAYSFIITNFGGILRLKDYKPYAASRGQCGYRGPPPVPLPVTGFRRVASDEKAMVKALYQYGPLSAAMNAKSMDVYKGSYIDEPTEDECSSKPESMDHSILIVGYNVYQDKKRTVPYWIIKNSWGDQWGDKGYYYLVRGRNACGIANDVSFAYVN